MKIREKNLLLVGTFCLFFTLINGCGVTQHNYIAHKAMNWFQPSLIGEEYSIFLSIIQNEQPSFQNGAAFPDWGYACGYSDESEAAHWPPFTLAGADYIQKNCGGTPSKWNRDCQKLVAFFFGIVSHQIADVAWHNLDAVSPTQQGFIQSMADVDFQGSFSSAHSVADTGAEFVVAKEFDLSFIDLNWYLPADELATIYQKLRYNVTSSDISRCNKLLYAEVHAVKIGGALLYPYAARQSPFLVDQLADFWLGGIDDNAIWTQWCWGEYLMFWFSPDISGPTRDYKLCNIQYSLFSQCERCFFDRNINYKFKKFIADLVEEKGGIVETVLENGNVVFSYDESFPITIAEAIEQFKKEIDQSPGETLLPSSSERATSCSSLPSNTISFTLDSQYTYLGNSLATGDLNNDNISDLVIGAPGFGNIGSPEQGALFVIPGNSSYTSGLNFTLDSPNLVGNFTHDRFGEAIAILDINLDGANDLIVGAPTTNAQTLQYIGELFVYFGDVSNPNKFFDTNLNFYNANLTFTSLYNFTNLANNLLVGDCNNDGKDDLIIGCPFTTPDGSTSHVQVGKVFIIYSSSSVVSSEKIHHIEDYANVTIEGQGHSEWFGYHIELGTNGKVPLLFVSSPTYGQSPPSVGRIYAFDINLLSSIQGNDYGNSLIFTISGNNKWDQVGYSVSFGTYDKSTTALAISSPGYTPTISIDSDQIGAVYLVDISSLSGDYTINNLRTIVKFEGDEKFGRFGWNVKLIDSTGSGDWELWISQPRKKTAKSEVEAGAVYQWDALVSAGHTNSPSESSNLCLYSDAPEGRFGQTIAFLDFNNDGVKDTVIASPRYSNNLIGAVSVLLS